MPRTLLITDRPWDDSDIERSILEPHGIQIVEAPAHDEATLARLAVNADAIATCWAKVTEPVLAAATNCRHVARMGIGLDNIDIAAATRLGIVVTNVPDYCVEEVAEHALAALLAMERNIAWFHFRTKRGEYDLAAGPEMRRLSERTLGLFGLGRIGQSLYHKANALGIQVIAHTASGNARGLPIEMVSWETLLERSDILSLHAPLTDETRHVLNGSAFAKMKPGMRLINTSRGGLIDEAALWSAIQKGQVAAAALDVFETEPPDLSRPLFQDERVIVTPHAAFSSRESVRDVRTRYARQVLAVLSGETPENVVNSPLPQAR